MNRKMSITLMGLGSIFLVVLFLNISFGTAEVSRILYTVLWFGCVGIMRFAASLWLGMER